jgi:hypothetical protein
VGQAQAVANLMQQHALQIHVALGRLWHRAPRKVHGIQQNVARLQHPIRISGDSHGMCEDVKPGMAIKVILCHHKHGQYGKFINETFGETIRINDCFTQRKFHT